MTGRNSFRESSLLFTLPNFRGQCCPSRAHIRLLGVTPLGALHFTFVASSWVERKKEMQRNRLIRSLCMFRVLFVPAVSLQMSRERQRSRCGDLSDTWRHLSAVFFRRISGSLEISCFAGITSTGGVLTGYSLVPGHFLKNLFRQFF